MKILKTLTPYNMIVDLILDRKAIKYSPKKFYNDLMGYYNAFPELVAPIADALDGGTEEQVKQALCNYITRQDYNPEICEDIQKLNWL